MACNDNDSLINYSSSLFPDTISLITAYLEHIVVSAKNTIGEMLRTSIQVFVEKRQTPVTAQQTPAVASYDATPFNATFDSLRSKFRDLCSLYEEHKNNRPMNRYANTILR